jgi:hypothetical protein
MAATTVSELRARADAAFSNINRQLQGMEPYLDRSDGPGEWTTREVLSHLLFESGQRPLDFLKRFAVKDLPLGEIAAGENYLNQPRRAMTLAQFVDALDTQRREIFAYLETVPPADLDQRKARIPLFKTFMGTDEISMTVYVGAMFDFHWNDHAGQLAKIRKAVGLPAA